MPKSLEENVGFCTNLVEFPIEPLTCLQLLLRSVCVRSKDDLSGSCVWCWSKVRAQRMLRRDEDKHCAQSSVTGKLVTATLSDGSVVQLRWAV